ncbi:MAG TPA: hypothetical protein PLF13_02705 [candidate division Zixibacteria bacterium]|nr:hypothetical protein [candidate division Zixibacteria bacterium]
MKTSIKLTIAGLLFLAAVPIRAEVYMDGFLQGLYGARLDENNPTATEQTASETRLQLRLEHIGEVGEFFGRVDFTYDDADSAGTDLELREGYMKFRLGSSLDFKVGRQIITWGTGDLIFINDVFAKDYRSFFVGRDDQYLKAPQNAIRTDFYPGQLGSISFVWTPRFEPNRLPTGRKLSYYNGQTIVGEGYYFDVPAPDAKFENGEFAFRYSRQVGNFTSALYFYKGFYKNPRGVKIIATEEGSTMMPFYPELNVYGASVRGPLLGGILWLEGGYFDSRQDRHGDDPLIPNSSATGMIGFERQVARNLTINGQWQVDYMTDYDKFEAEMAGSGMYVRDEVRHLLTSRITRLLMRENLTLSGFIFYSPSDEDWYLRTSAAYKYSDELELAVGANVFDGSHESTDYGQFQKNDNVYLKMTYGF